MADFGQRLRALRQSHGYGQRQLAEKLNVAQTTIANYEANSRFPGPDTLRQLADVFLVSIDFLMGREGWGQEGGSPWNESFRPDEPKKLELAIQNGQVNEAMGFLQEQLDASGNLDQVFDYYVAPLMESVFRRWQDGKVPEAAAMQFFDHMRIITHHIPSLFPSQRQAYGRDGFAVLAPDNEHDIGLRLVSDRLKTAGWNMFFLGSGHTPQRIKEFSAEGMPRLLCIGAALDTHVEAAERMIAAVRSLGAAAPVILVGGPAFRSQPKLAKDIGADGSASHAGEVPGLAERLLKQRQKAAAPPSRH